MKNKIIIYKGGGYDGCFWEPNYSIYDAEGMYRILYASGIYGCRTDKEMRERISEVDEEESGRDETYFGGGMWYDIYDLTQEGVDEMWENENKNVASNVVRRVEELYYPEYSFTLKCDVCEGRFDQDDIMPGGYRGIGGVAIEMTNYMCSSCILDEGADDLVDEVVSEMKYKMNIPDEDLIPQEHLDIIRELCEEHAEIGYEGCAVARVDEDLVIRELEKKFGGLPYVLVDEDDIEGFDVSIWEDEHIEVDDKRYKNIETVLESDESQSIKDWANSWSDYF